MAITYQSEGITMPSFPKRKTTEWIRKVAGQQGKKTGDISYIFCSDKYILEINKQYLNHDYYTDIITFDYSEDKVISGDIFISLDTVKTNAEKYQATYEEEFYRVIIHGILHLCGINDKTPEEEKRMREEENKALEVREKK
ncbi:MAG: rRNA maturation RNase YbeY [Candidatus Azobacteroides sp.]|nr:rRNA maturation RNase YbeY [Candidatus Azobacteroides sp.]